MGGGWAADLEKRQESAGRVWNMEAILGNNKKRQSSSWSGCFWGLSRQAVVQIRAASRPPSLHRTLLPSMPCLSALLLVLVDTGAVYICGPTWIKSLKPCSLLKGMSW